MRLAIHTAMLGYPVVVLLLYLTLPARRATLASALLGWLFLPIWTYSFSGLPEYGKLQAVNIWCAVGVLLLDSEKRWKRLRLRWFDLPILAYCLSPATASLANGLGAYDAATGLVKTFIRWGLPYFIGRVYFSDWKGVRALAIAVLVGGLIYVPFCLFEIRMSPKLHREIYGFHQTAFHMTQRWGGYRPNVFLEHGLALGLWMTSATLCGYWLWRTGALTRLRAWSMGFLTLGIGVVSILCKSTGALALLALGLATLWGTRRFRTKFLLLGLLLVAPVYVAVRCTGRWSVEPLVELTREINPERAQSLSGRLFNEGRLIEKAWQRPLFGWGGWGRNRIYDEEGEDITVTDGFWIIVFGQKGWFGLGAIGLALLLPLGRLWRRFSAKELVDPRVAPAVALGVVVVLFAIDSLLNAMLNPFWMLAMGGVIAVADEPMDENRNELERDEARNEEELTTAGPGRRDRKGFRSPVGGPQARPVY